MQHTLTMTQREDALLRSFLWAYRRAHNLIRDDEFRTRWIESQFGPAARRVVFSALQRPEAVQVVRCVLFPTARAA